MPLAFIVSILMAAPSPLLNAAPIIQPDSKEIWIEKLHECENVDNVPWIIDSNGKRSYGYVMFQESTWLSYGKYFGATMDNISDDELQKKVARSMLDNGLWRHWYTCSKKTMKVLGAYPI